MARQAKDIEALLSWAYRDELPKRAIGGLTGWEKLVLLGTTVDDERRPDEVGFPVNMGPPHPDALLIDHAVRTLEPVTMLWEIAREGIMGDLSPYAPADDPTLRRMQFSPMALVMMHAKMGTRPAWDLGPTSVKRIQGGNGKPKVHGITAGHRYETGAHCPLQLDPPAREIACARAEYAVWHAALMTVTAELESWNLKDFAPQYPKAAPAPWIEDTERKPRIFRNNSITKMIA